MPTDTDQSASLAHFLPFSLRDFFVQYYDRTMLRLNHTATNFNPNKMWDRSDFAGNLIALAADGKLRQRGGAIKTFGRTKLVGLDEIAPVDAAALIQAKMADGESFMLSFEKVSPSNRPMKYTIVPTPPAMTKPHPVILLWLPDGCQMRSST